jgi:periplasmic protein TonB
VPTAATNALSAPAFPWRRALIALWASAAAHLLLLSFIRVTPAPIRAQSVTLQVRLDMPATPEVSIPLLQSEVTSDPLETVPLPKTQVSSEPSAENLPPQTKEPVAPHIDLPQLADTTYYDALALDSPQLQPIGSVEPIDPEAGSSNPHTGYVRLQLKLEADGRVSDATVLESNMSPKYEKAAIEAFGNARFQPARRNGSPVRARFKVELTFKAPPATDSR